MPEKSETSSKKIDSATKKVTRTQRSLEKSIEKVRKSYERQNKSALANISKVAKQQNKAFKSFEKSSVKQTKTTQTNATKQLKVVQKMTRDQAKSYDKMFKQISKSQKSIGGGFRGIALPAVLSVAGLSALTLGVSKYVQSLGRAKAVLRGLTGRGGLASSSREAGLFAGVAGQQFSNRFMNKNELQGIRTLRESLAKSGIGGDQANELTKQITAGFKGSSQELRKFLALAGTNLPKALKAFQGFEVNSMATALRLITVEGSATEKVASNLTRLWENVKDRFEGFAETVINSNAGDINKTIDSIRDSVLNVITSMESWAEKSQPVFSFVLKSVQTIQKAIDVIKNPGKSNFIQGINDTLFEVYNNWFAGGKKLSPEQLEKVLAKRSGDRLNEVVNESIPKFTKFSDVLKKTADNMKDLNKAAGDTARPRVLTAVEQATKNLEGLQQPKTTAALRTDLARSNLELQKDKFGGSLFGGQGLAGMQKAMNAEREIIQREITNLENIKTPDALQKQLIAKKKLIDLDRESLNLVRALRDGYLSSLVAQAQGAGRFSKIIVNQDKQVSQALDHGLAAKNMLLGSSSSLGQNPFTFKGTNTQALDRWRNKQLNIMGAPDMIRRGLQVNPQAYASGNTEAEILKSIGKGINKLVNIKSAKPTPSSSQAGAIRGNKPTNT